MKWSVLTPTFSQTNNALAFTTYLSSDKFLPGIYFRTLFTSSTYLVTKFMPLLRRVGIRAHVACPQDTCWARYLHNYQFWPYSRRFLNNYSMTYSLIRGLWWWGVTTISVFIEIPTLGKLPSKAKETRPWYTAIPCRTPTWSFNILILFLFIIIIVIILVVVAVVNDVNTEQFFAGCEHCNLLTK